MSRFLPRRVVLPESVRSRLGSGERVLAAAHAEDGTWLVGTRDHLHAFSYSLSDSLSDSGSSRWPWEQVQRADWDAETSSLRVEPLAEFGAQVTTAAYRLSEPGGLLELVRERVTASVVMQRRVDLVRKRGVTVIARRPPSGLGPVVWAVVYDEGLEPDDVAVAQVVETTLREAQESLGV